MWISCDLGYVGMTEQLNSIQFNLRVIYGFQADPLNWRKPPLMPPSVTAALLAWVGQWMLGCNSALNWIQHGVIRNGVTFGRAGSLFQDISDPMCSAFLFFTVMAKARLRKKFNSTLSENLKWLISLDIGLITPPVNAKHLCIPPKKL